MANPRSSKRQLEKTRQERAVAKRERRRTRPELDATDDGPADEVSQAVLLAQLAELHERYAQGALTFEDFESTKSELTARLRVD